MLTKSFIYLFIYLFLIEKVENPLFKLKTYNSSSMFITFEPELYPITSNLAGGPV